MTRRIALVALCCVVLSLGIVAAWLASRDDSLTRHQSVGVLRVGYAVEAPYAFLTPEGLVTGESPEVARVIAGRLNIERIEWVQTDFASLLEDLARKRFDVVAAGMFITPERTDIVAFSHPTFEVLPGLLVPRGNPRRVRDYKSLLARRDLRLAVLDGSVEQTLLEPLSGFHRLLVVSDAVAGRAAVLSGTADGLALSEPTVRWMAGQPGAAKLEAVPLFSGKLPPNTEPGRGAFAFRKVDVALRNAWNEALESYLGSPDHEKLIGKFGFLPREIPGARPSGRVAQ